MLCNEESLDSSFYHLLIIYVGESFVFHILDLHLWHEHSTKLILYMLPL